MSLPPLGHSWDTNAPKALSSVRNEKRADPDLKGWFAAGKCPTSVPAGKIKDLHFCKSLFLLAGGPGFEPGLTESESVVLPLDDPPVGLGVTC